MFYIIKWLPGGALKFTLLTVYLYFVYLPGCVYEALCPSFSHSTRVLLLFLHVLILCVLWAAEIKYVCMYVCISFRFYGSITQKADEKVGKLLKRAVKCFNFTGYHALI